MFRPEGIYPALLTPFQEDQQVNEPELRKLLDFVIDRGLDGIFPISSNTGGPGHRVFYGSYYDEVVKTSRGWRISHRVFSTKRRSD